MSTHPRHVEVLLSSLGARSEFGDALIGDLAEDFALRAERDGARAARRWYYRQALRAIPHLVRSWWETARARDVRRILGVAATSYIMVLMIGLVVISSGISVASALGVPKPGPEWISLPSVRAGILILGCLETGLAGYIAAWLDARTPMFSAAVLGLVWATLQFVQSGSPAIHLPLWSRFAATTIALVGPIAGGMLRLAKSGISSEDEPDEVRARPSPMA